MTVRSDLLRSLWKGRDPFEWAQPREPDISGWNSDHLYLTEVIHHYRPEIVVEVGVWKGASVLTMARAMWERGIDGVIIAVDTWLGSAEHWGSVPRNTDGSSSLYQLFLSNVASEGLAGYVVPLPLDSLSAVSVLGHHNVRPSVIHIDGAHDVASVRRDLDAWWELLTPGGMLVADDYHTWPTVKTAVDAFCADTPHRDFESNGPKCRFVKV